MKRMRNLQKSFVFILSIAVLLTGFTLPVAANQDELIGAQLDDFYDWVIDEENGYIYAITGTDIVILNMADLSVVHEFPASYGIFDIELDGSMLYVLDTEGKVHVMNVMKKQIVRDIDLAVNSGGYVFDIAVDAEKIFYTQSNGSYQKFFLTEYNLNTNQYTRIRIKNDIEKKYQDALLTMDQENNVLYVADYEGLEAISTNDYSRISQIKYKGELDYEPNMYFAYTNGEILYSGFSIDATDLTKLNGQFDGLIYSYSDDYLVTDVGIYNRTNFNQVLGYGYMLIDKNENIYYIDMNDRAVRINLNSVLNENYQDYISFDNSIAFDSELSDWVMDKTNNMLYAISEENNKLYYIDLNTGKVMNELFIGSNPMDIELYEGKLYVSLKGANKIAVANTSYDGKISSFVTENNPYQIEVDNNKIFYVSKGYYHSLHYVDINDQSEQVISLQMMIDEANLSLDSNQNLLFVGVVKGELENTVVSINTGNLTVQSKSTLADLVSYSLKNDQTDVFFGKHVLDGNNLATSNGEISFTNTNEEVIAVTDSYIFTNQVIYDRNTLKKITLLPYELSLIEINESEIFAFNNESWVLTKYESMEEFLSDWSLFEEGQEPEITEELNNYIPTDLGSHWAYAELTDFLRADIITGYRDEEGNTLIKPNKSVTRAEFVTILVRALGLTGTENAISFTDVKQNTWYTDAVAIASSNGIISGYTETTFAPNATIKRGEIATIIVRAFEETVNFEGEPKGFNDLANHWSKPFVEKASAAGIINGLTPTNFGPGAEAKRAEAVAMLYRALHLEESDLPEDQMLEDFITDYEMTNHLAYSNLDFEQLTEQSIANETGFIQAYSDYDIDALKKLIDSGVTRTSKLVGDVSAEVIDSSNRFAAVELKGAIYEYSYKKGELEKNFQFDGSSVNYLKKMADGQWKIYNFEFTNPQSLGVKNDSAPIRTKHSKEIASSNENKNGLNKSR